MSEPEIWMLAVGLAMDCFSVSIAAGLDQRRWQWRPMLLMAVCFGLFQSVMPLLGWLLTSRFEEQIEAFDHWIAFMLLLFLGINMIRDEFREEDDKVFDTTRLSVILTLSIATSIDALAVGISFACMGLSRISSLWHPLAVIGLVSFMLSIAGLHIGICGGHLAASRIHPGLLGGIILIGIGCRVLIEHLS